VLTGSTDAGVTEQATDLAKKLEKMLFRRNFKSYYLGLNNLFLGLENELGSTSFDRDSLIRRLGELARIITDAGLIFITSVPDLDEYDLRALKLLNKPNELVVINVGPTELQSGNIDLQLNAGVDFDQATDELQNLLKKKQVILDYHI